MESSSPESLQVKEKVESLLTRRPSVPNIQATTQLLSHPLVREKYEVVSDIVEGDGVLVARVKNRKTGKIVSLIILNSSLFTYCYIENILLTFFLFYILV